MGASYSYYENQIGETLVEISSSSSGTYGTYVVPTDKAGKPAYNHNKWDTHESLLEKGYRCVNREIFIEYEDAWGNPIVSEEE